MKLTKLGLAATTALGLSMAMAQAADDNMLYLEQDGNGNVAEIEQHIQGFAGNVGGHDFGTSGNSATQDGDNNLMRFSIKTTVTQNVGNEDNDVVDADQKGDGNRMNFEAFGGSTHGRVNDADQDGDNNVMDVDQWNVDFAVIDRMLQQGNGNTLRISQERKTGTTGLNNTVLLVSQIGNGNNGTGSNSGIYVRQRGGNLMVQEASILGDNNPSAITIVQSGTDNGRSLSEAKIHGSNGNTIDILQIGDANNFGVYQGNSLADTGNMVDLDQNGMGNFVTITQQGDNHRVTANFSGDGNGVGTMTGVAGALVDSDWGDDLYQGNMFQDSDGTAGGNSITYNVTGSNNLFAFAQIGAANSITGNVGTAGASNGNQVAVLQDGSGNGTSFTQNGGGFNNLAVSQ